MKVSVPFRNYPSAGVGKRKYYQQVYLKLCKLLDNLDDLNLQAESFAEEDEYHLIWKSDLLLHDKLLDFINDVFVWRDHKEMGNYLGEIQSLTSDS